MVDTDERWVGVEEVAAHLGVTTTSVYRWVESRGLPAHRVGRLFRFRLTEVDTWVTDHRVGPAAPAPVRLVGTDAVESAIDEMVRIIVQRFDPERVVLFGSHARGHAGPDSDVDLLVVLRFTGSKREKEIEIGVALHEIRTAKDIVVVSPEEVERFGDVAGTIIRPALREGRILYERAV